MRRMELHGRLFAGLRIHTFTEWHFRSVYSTVPGDWSEAGPNGSTAPRTWLNVIIKPRSSQRANGHLRSRRADQRSVSPPDPDVRDRHQESKCVAEESMLMRRFENHNS